MIISFPAVKNACRRSNEEAGPTSPNSLEVRHGVFVGVRHPLRLHHRIVRYPDDPAGHRCRAAQETLLLQYQCARSGVRGGERRDHATTARSDDHDIDRAVPLRRQSTSPGRARSRR